MASRNTRAHGPPFTILLVWLFRPSSTARTRGPDISSGRSRDMLHLPLGEGGFEVLDGEFALAREALHVAMAGLVAAGLVLVLPVPDMEPQHVQRSAQMRAQPLHIGAQPGDLGIRRRATRWLTGRGQSATSAAGMAAALVVPAVRPLNAPALCDGLQGPGKPKVFPVEGRHQRALPLLPRLLP